MLECRYCKKTFSKGEHLRRHERGHTGSKPYQCKECKRSFSRQDSLARHEKLHVRRRTPYETDSSPTASASASASVLSVDRPPVTPESIGSNSTGDLNDGVPGAEHTSHVHVEPTVFSISVPAAAVPQQDVGGEREVGAGIPAPTTDLDFDLIWPDSEDLFQSLMSFDSANQWQMPLGTLPFSASPSTGDVSLGTPSLFDERPPSIGAIPSGGNHQAVQDVSKMVSNLSSSVTAAVKSNSITSVFLDECLHMFFVKFIPTFPVLHRATFVFRECAHPLLLNAIAIGSLYLGPVDTLAKGEALWHLAHTAVATSWQNLITHRGPYDSCEGVQLVLTSALSQVYGALSKNRTIRSTSQAFHSLGLVWARRCGMLDCPPYDTASVVAVLDDPDALESEKEHQWRLWVAREIQQRAVLAHYMLDGLISHMSGEPTSVRHATNPLTLPSDEATFEACTATEWISHMQQRRRRSVGAISFRSIMRRLFSDTAAIGGEPRWFDTDNNNTDLSAFAYKVILEGLQSLISDDNADEDDDSGEEQDTAVGVPTRSEVRRALVQVYESIQLNGSLSREDRLETLLRWHAICLDTRVDSAALCRKLCARHDITQYIWQRGGDGHGIGHNDSHPHSPSSIQTGFWTGTKSQTNTKSANFDAIAWASTPSARAALLHATAIQEIVEQLPRGRAHTIHMPSSLFAASTVYAAFALGSGRGRGQSTTVKIPVAVVWQDVLLPRLSMGFDDADTTTARYIRGDTLQGWSPTCASSAVTSRNLLYELNSLHKLFRCLLAQWGVAHDMESVVEKWIGLCH